MRIIVVIPRKRGARSRGASIPLDPCFRGDDKETGDSAKIGRAPIQTLRKPLQGLARAVLTASCKPASSAYEPRRTPRHFPDRSPIVRSRRSTRPRRSRRRCRSRHDPPRAFAILCAPDVAGPNGGGQALVGVVGLEDGVVFVLEGCRLQHRPEDLLAGDGHVIAHIGEDRRLDEIASGAEVRHRDGCGNARRSRGTGPNRARLERSDPKADARRNRRRARQARGRSAPTAQTAQREALTSALRHGILFEDRQVDNKFARTSSTATNCRRCRACRCGGLPGY